MAWLPKCRALLVRYDKHAANFLGLLQFAGALPWFRPPSLIPYARYLVANTSILLLVSL